MYEFIEDNGFVILFLYYNEKFYVIYLFLMLNWKEKVLYGYFVCLNL